MTVSLLDLHRWTTTRNEDFVTLTLARLMQDHPAARARVLVVCGVEEEAARAPARVSAQDMVFNADLGVGRSDIEVAGVFGRLIIEAKVVTCDPAALGGQCEFYAGTTPAPWRVVPLTPHRLAIPDQVQLPRGLGVRSRHPRVRGPDGPLSITFADLVDALSDVQSAQEWVELVHALGLVVPDRALDVRHARSAREYGSALEAWQSQVRRLLPLLLPTTAGREVVEALLASHGDATDDIGWYVESPRARFPDSELVALSLEAEVEGNGLLWHLGVAPYHRLRGRLLSDPHGLGWRALGDGWFVLPLGGFPGETLADVGPLAVEAARRVLVTEDLVATAAGYRKVRSGKARACLDVATLVMQHRQARLIEETLDALAELRTAALGNGYAQRMESEMRKGRGALPRWCREDRRLGYGVGSDLSVVGDDHTGLTAWVWCAWKRGRDAAQKAFEAAGLAPVYRTEDHDTAWVLERKGGPDIETALRMAVAAAVDAE